MKHEFLQSTQILHLLFLSEDSLIRGVSQSMVFLQKMKDLSGINRKMASLEGPACPVREN